MSFWDTYISPYITDFTSGWNYGDYAESSLDLPDSGLSSFLYTAGDYAEDIYDYSGLDTVVDYASPYVSTAWDWTKKGVSAWGKGADALSKLDKFFGDDKPRALPKAGKVSADGRYSTGSFTAGQAADGRVGLNSSGTQRGAYRMASNSDLQWVSSLMGGQAQLTSRGGRTTIRIDPTSPISLRSSTRIPT